MHTHMVELEDRPGGYVFAAPSDDGSSRHTHTVKLKDGSTVQTGPSIGHGPSHAHMLPDGSMTSDPLDADQAFRTGWLPSIMHSSFGDWSGLSEIPTTAIVVGVGAIVLIAAYMGFQHWKSMSPEERADARRRQVQMTLIREGGSTARSLLRR